MDYDFDVDQADFDVFAGCSSGPNIPYTGDCYKSDLDTDSDIDQSDFGIFQRCISGQDRRRIGKAVTIGNDIVV